MATGCLSSPNLPSFEGLETFQGERYHTGYWPHEEVDFTGKRVAVIGTGSSAVQSIPIIAGQAKQLTVFQRTANYAIPAHNAPLTPEYRSAIKADYPAMRARARKNMTGIDFDYSDAVALETPAGGAHARVRAALAARRPVVPRRLQGPDGRPGGQRHGRRVRARQDPRARCDDPRLAELLAPKNTIGCKRLCIDIGYYETFNRPNVTLVDVSESGIEAITRQGVQGAGPGIRGRRHRVRHRLRRHDRGAAEDRHPRPRRPGAAREVARGAAHVSGAGHGRLPQPVHRHRSRQSLGADQHAAHHRAARRLDRRHLGLSARPRPRPHRGRASRPRRTGSPTSASWPAARCATPAAPGIWASTSPASRACSCPTSAAFRATSRNASEVAGRGYEGFLLG